MNERLIDAHNAFSKAEAQLIATLRAVYPVGDCCLWERDEHIQEGIVLGHHIECARLFALNKRTKKIVTVSTFDIIKAAP